MQMLHIGHRYLGEVKTGFIPVLVMLLVLGSVGELVGAVDTKPGSGSAQAPKLDTFITGRVDFSAIDSLIVSLPKILVVRRVDEIEALLNEQLKLFGALTIIQPPDEEMVHNQLKALERGIPKPLERAFDLHPSANRLFRSSALLRRNYQLMIRAVSPATFQKDMTDIRDLMLEDMAHLSDRIDNPNLDIDFTTQARVNHLWIEDLYEHVASYSRLQNQINTLGGVHEKALTQWNVFKNTRFKEMERELSRHIIGSSSADEDGLFVVHSTGAGILIMRGDVSGQPVYFPDMSDLHSVKFIDVVIENL